MQMVFRLALAQDLQRVKAVYREIIRNMDRNQISIWDDVYPCAFFEEDIRQERLYLLLDQDEITAAFALCSANAGEKAVEWQAGCRKAMYLDRLGVNVDYLRRGIGSLMLEKAKEAARNLGAEALRLFVVDINAPAIRLYVKNGFARADGVYDEIIDDNLTLHEYGFEAVL